MSVCEEDETVVDMDVEVEDEGVTDEQMVDIVVDVGRVRGDIMVALLDVLLKNKGGGVELNECECEFACRLEYG